MKSIVRGVGINDADYAVFTGPVGARKMCPYYSRWKGLIERCYGASEIHKRNYEGCSLDDRWLSFMAFKAWMISQPWRNNHLDKDILQCGSKRYSPDTCVFIPSWLNALVVERTRRDGSLPDGVSRNRRSRTNPFQARIWNGEGVRICLGAYESADRASIEWRSAKSQMLLRAAHRYQSTPDFDERVHAALLERSNKLLG